MASQPALSPPETFSPDHLLPEGPHQYELPLSIRKAIRELPLHSEIQHSWNEIEMLLHQFLEKPVADRYFAQLRSIAVLPSLEEKRTKLLELVKSHSPHTYEHSQKVRQLAEVGKGIFPVDMDAVAAGLEMHDIGKLVVQPEVIEKPGDYEDADWAQMKLHPVLSSHLLDVMGFDFMTRQIGLYHHLRTKTLPSGKTNITGYPFVEIKTLPEVARVASLFDVYEALTSPSRPVKRIFEEGDKADVVIATENYTPAEALQLMREKIFNDPSYADLLDAFEKTMNLN